MIPKRKPALRLYLATAPCDARFEIRVPAELLDAAERYAKKHKQPLSYVVKYALARTVGE